MPGLNEAAGQLESTLRTGDLNGAHEYVREYCLAATICARDIDDDPTRQNVIRQIITTLDSAIELLKAHRTQLLTEARQAARSGQYLSRESAPGACVGVNL